VNPNNHNFFQNYNPFTDSKKNTLVQGNHKKKLPIFWLGMWALSGHKYGQTKRKDALECMELAIDKNITAFDTSPFYGKGESDTLLSMFTKKKNLFISTKIGLEWDKNTVRHCGSKEKIKKHVYQSLEKLNIPYFDIVQLHWPDPKVPLETSIEAILSLRDEGVCKFWGACNISKKSVEILHSMTHETPLVQVKHNVLNPCSSFSNKGAYVAYSPFEQGFLLDPQIKDRIGKKDIRNKNTSIFNESKIEFIVKYLENCKEKNNVPEKNYLSYIFKSSPCQSVILGCRNTRQLEKILTCF
jgi:aryl-alcohol dehydrogenase-like predicted oxidoreductase